MAVWQWIIVVVGGYILVQWGYVFAMLIAHRPERTVGRSVNRAARGVSDDWLEEYDDFMVQHLVEDGIERIIYRPKDRRHDTPVFMQHGMWAGAWCWQPWQVLLAQWGWESHAISLPGHGRSPTQRALPACTLDYYLNFITAEIERLPRKPVWMGHSMGGALGQWYLKYIGELPAAVFVSPWVADSVMADGAAMIVRRDPAVVPLVMLTWQARAFVRNPQRAAESLITPGAVLTPEDLHAQLGSESALVLLQHNAPFWRPPANVSTPSLWLGGELDKVVTPQGIARSARIFGGEYVEIAGSGHNLMMEASNYATAQLIDDWLRKNLG